MMMKEGKSLRDLFFASLALSFLTIVPPLLVMSVVDKVITHQSFSTLFLMSVIAAAQAITNREAFAITTQAACLNLRCTVCLPSNRLSAKPEAYHANAVPH